MIIGDKAWEPEWCVTASNYKTMIKTAKRLKHPVFCFIDNEGPMPEAYFYVYYGENNYCYTYNGQLIEIGCRRETLTKKTKVQKTAAEWNRKYCFSFRRLRRIKRKLIIQIVIGIFLNNSLKSLTEAKI